MFAGEDRRPARCTDGVGDARMIEPHALLGNPVNIGGLDQAVVVGRDGLVRMVIRHDEDDVGPAGGRGGSGLARGGEGPKQGKGQGADLEKCSACMHRCLF